jgi:hypothetical protein
VASVIKELASTVKFTSSCSSRLHGHFSVAFSFPLNFSYKFKLLRRLYIVLMRNVFIIHLSKALQSCCWTLAAFSVFLILYAVSRTPWTGDRPVTRPLPTQTQIKRSYTSMPRVGFELMIPAFKQAKTVHVIDRSATLIAWNVFIAR